MSKLKTMTFFFQISDQSRQLLQQMGILDEETHQPAKPGHEETQ